jgi:ABC-2 type transport system ATP-binding protein
VRDNVETLYGAIDDGAIAVRIPQHAKKELEAYLDCGLLCRGFARLRCERCDESRRVAFGMRQRLSLAQALMEKLLLLDEPTNGLDPAGIVDLRELLTEVASEGTAIFLASHMLTEVERICERVLLVRAGEMLKAIDLRAPGPARVRVVVSTEKDVELILGSGLSAERPSNESGSSILLLTPRGSVPDLVRELVRLGANLEEIAEERRSLEKEFLSLFR